MYSESAAFACLSQFLLCWATDATLDSECAIAYVRPGMFVSGNPLNSAHATQHTRSSLVAASQPLGQTPVSDVIVISWLCNAVSHIDAHCR